MHADESEQPGQKVISTREQCVDAAVTEKGCSPKAAQFVVRVLDMWELLEASARGLCPSDQRLLTDSISPRGYSVRFPSFDGGGELESLQIAQFLVDALGQWPTFKGRVVLADAPSIRSYERMLTAFDSVYTPTGGYDPLDVDDLIVVLNARL
ncbi:uncharacterized protein YfbU (UPF0304 family) [Pseudomonas sp. BS3782 TE3695]|uniref:YfbU family protein n=1 Tax=Pseudomonas sp. BS3782 TE3695 TaxID=3349323 RepID=UPI003D25F0C2